ncbi:ankyrin repeat-containing domain protein [Dichotomopilus funicola]|uniref:Ankyrin repeat-containing domain protein n=1 Tax=Dichotomopilus funicola TaxID=1934379 RepID=A0AAN6ZP33_9PEZI|nr:ankyrin repeat-containing domain protein [Dichotomopilus funicola]
MEQVQLHTSVRILIVTGVLGEQAVHAAAEEDGEETLPHTPMGFLAQHFPQAGLNTFHGIKSLDQTSTKESAHIPEIDLRERAEELLRYLDAERAQLQEDSGAHLPRWIIICHDIGSYVVEQALVLAESERYYHWIRESIAAIMLFDTPHTTLGRRTRDRLVLQILASSELAPWPDVASFVHSLLRAIDQLEWESRPVLEGLRVVNFFSRGYPDQQRPGAVFEADPRTCGGHYHNSTATSTRLDCEIGHVLKLRGDEPAADSIVESIKKCLPNSPSEPHDARTRLLQAIWDVQPEEYRGRDSVTHSQAPAAHTINDWVTNTDWYRSWVENSAESFRLLRERGDLVLSFSFAERDSNTAVGRPAEDLIFSLCQQTLRSLFQSQVHLPLCSWLVEWSILTKEAMKGLLFSLVSTAHTGGSLYCVIHGIHLLASRAQQEVLGDIKGLIEAAQSPLTLKLLLATDRGNLCQGTGSDIPCHVVDVVEEHQRRETMKSLASAHLDALALCRPAWREKALREKAIQKLCNESATMFEVAQKFSFLETTAVPATTSAMHALLDRVPGSLEAALDDEWRKLTRPRAVEVAAVPWVLHASRPLRPSELAVCVALSMTTDTQSLDQFKSHISWNPADDLRRVLGPIIVVSGDRVRVRHQTYGDFLRKKSGPDLPQDGHLYLLSQCLKYLNLIGKHWVPPSAEPGRYGLSRESWLAEYACLNWAHHHRHALDKFEAARQTCDRHDGKLPTSAVEVAAHFGLVEVVEQFLGQPGFCEDSSEQLRVSLDSAAQGGFVEIAKLLLNRGIRSPGALRKAARFGHDGVLRALLNGDGELDLDAVDENGYNVLLEAARGGHIKAVGELLERGAPVNSATSTGLTALHLACKIGQLDISQTLANNRADLTLQDKSGYSAVMYAAEGGFTSVVRALVRCSERGPLPLGDENGTDKEEPQVTPCSPVNINAANSDGNTALHLAVSGGHRSTVKLLLELEASRSVKNHVGHTPLHIAVQFGHLGITADLINAASATSEKGDDDRGDEVVQFGSSLSRRPAVSPLEIAVQHRHLGIIRAILGSRHHVNKKTAANAVSYACAIEYPQGVLEILRWYKESEPDQISPLGDAERNTALHLAVESFQTALVGDLLEGKYVPVDFPNDLGWSPLHIAAKTGQLAVIQQLRQHGASITQSTKRGQLALHIAAQHGQGPACKELLPWKGGEEEKAAVSLLRTKDEDGYTPLFLAAAADHLGIVRELLELDKGGAGQGLLHLAVEKDSEELLNIAIASSPDLNWKDDTGNAAIHLAVRKDKAAIVQALHKAGASVSITDEQGRTPLYIAVEEKVLGTINALVDLEGANLKPNEPCDGITAFLKACYDFTLDPDRGLEITRLLLEKFPPGSSSGDGIEINIEDPETGRTPLHYASDTGSDDLTIILLDLGANPNKPNNRGSTPILLAAEMGKVKSVQALVDKGANFRIANNSGVTPLHRAAYDNHAECVRLLLNLGADPNFANDWGYTPVALAALHGHVECVGVFLDHNKLDKPNPVDFAVKNPEGLCILGLAVSEDEGQVVDLLLERLDEREVRLAIRNAVTSGAAHVVKTLLQKTTPVHGKLKLDDERYGTLLGLAVVKQRSSVVSMLLDDGWPGMEVDETDADGRTPLMYAVMKGDGELVSMLLKAHANPNRRDGAGETPLLRAIKEEDPGILASLIETEGADWEQKDGRGHSLLYWACRLPVKREVFDTVNNALKKSPQYAQLCELAVHGAVARDKQYALQALLSVPGLNLDAEDADGWTARYTASCYDLQSVNDMLVESGAKVACPPAPRPMELRPGDHACGLVVDKNTVDTVRVARACYPLDDEDFEDATYGTFRANHCLPADRDWYFEVLITAPQGSCEVVDTLGIGICEDSADLVGMLGFGRIASLSIGYHGDDGDVYASGLSSQNRNIPPSQTFSSDDFSVGCGFEWETKSVFFTKNGEYLGKAFVNIPGAKLYPAIFTSTANVGVEMSFRFSGPWDFDPDAPRRQRPAEGSEEEDRANDGPSESPDSEADSDSD